MPDSRFTNTGSARNWKSGCPKITGFSKSTPWNESLHAALGQKGIAYQTLIEDQDFHNGGVQGWLVMLSTLIVVAGTVLLLRRPGTQKFYQQETATPRAERTEKNIIRRVRCTGNDRGEPSIGSFRNSNGPEPFPGRRRGESSLRTKTPGVKSINTITGQRIMDYSARKRTYTGFTAPADESTLALLAENKISHTTMVQGRDFGHREPGRGLLLLCIFVLAAGATCLLWRVVKENRTLPAPAGSTV